MEFEEKQEEDGDDLISVIQAFKKLYGLLQIKETDTSPSSQYMDEKSKHILKRLLDGATEQAFQSHCNIMPVRPSGPNMDYNIKLGPQTSKCSPQSQCVCGKKRLLHVKGEVERLNFTWKSSIPSEESRGCSYNYLHHKDEIATEAWERGNKSRKTLMHKTVRKTQDIQSETPTLDASSSRPTWARSDNETPDKIIDVSEEDVAKALQHMEACELVDHHRDLTCDTVSSIKWNSMVGTYHGSGMLGPQDVEIRNNVPSEMKPLLHQSGKPVLDTSGVVLGRMGSRKDRLLRQVSKLTEDSSALLSHWKMKEAAVPHKGEFGSQLSRKYLLERNDLLSQVARTHLPARMPRLREKRLIVKENETPRLPVQTQTVEPTLLRVFPRRTHAKKKEQKMRINQLGRMERVERGFMRGEYRPTSVTCRKSELDLHNKYLPHRQMPKAKVVISSSASLSSSSPLSSLSSSSDYSSSWTTLETSCNSDSDGEVYSLPRRMVSHRFVGIKSDMGQKNGGPKPQLARPTVRSHAGPATIERSYIEKDVEKKIGRLRRFKNKLGVIFHHHHHHHHHHKESGKSLDRTPSPNPNHSFWKYVRQMLHHTSRENQEKLAVKRVVKNAPRHHQRGHLHGLVDGLVKHVWHSKKSKPSKGRVKGLGGKKKAVKKWHWWQRFYKRRSVVKRINSGKPRVKLGFRARRPQLQYKPH